MARTEHKYAVRSHCCSGEGASRRVDPSVPFEVHDRDFFVTRLYVLFPEHSQIDLVVAGGINTKADALSFRSTKPLYQLGQLLRDSEGGAERQSKGGPVYNVKTCLKFRISVFGVHVARHLIRTGRTAASHRPPGMSNA